MAYRATRTEPRVSVGEWTKDLSKGQVFETAAIPDDVAEYLIEQGLLFEVPDNAEDNPWFDSEDPELAEPGSGSVDPEPATAKAEPESGTKTTNKK